MSTITLLEGLAVTMGIVAAANVAVAAIYVPAYVRRRMAG